MCKTIKEKQIFFFRWFSHFYFCGIVCNSLVMLATINTYLYSGTWPLAIKYIMDMLGHSESGNISHV